MRSAFLLILFFTSLPKLLAQDSLKTTTVWNVQAHYGFIIPHSSELKPVSNSNPAGLQLDWSKLLLSQKAWNSCNCFSQLGVSASYINFGNPQQLGNAYSLVFFSEPYLNYQQSLYFSFRAGIGPTFLNQVYDEVSNPENTFYSAQLSFLLLANFSINYRLSPQLSLQAVGYYNHISNGGWKQPNKGINFPTFGLGLRYYPKPIDLPDWPRNQSNKGKLQAYTRLFAAIPKVSADSVNPEVRRLQVGLAAGGLYFISQLNAINLGFELVRDGARKEARERKGATYDFHSIGIMLGHNFVFGRFTFNQQMGWYAYRPYPSDQAQFYQRYELLYSLGQLQLGTGLKAHGDTAENIDLRIGWLF